MASARGPFRTDSARDEGQRAARGAPRGHLKSIRARQEEPPRPLRKDPHARARRVGPGPPWDMRRPPTLGGLWRGIWGAGGVGRRPALSFTPFVPWVSMPMGLRWITPPRVPTPPCGGSPAPGRRLLGTRGALAPRRRRYTAYYLPCTGNSAVGLAGTRQSRALSPLLLGSAASRLGRSWALWLWSWALLGALALVLGALASADRRTACARGLAACRPARMGMGGREQVGWHKGAAQRSHTHPPTPTVGCACASRCGLGPAE